MANGLPVIPIGFSDSESEIVRQVTGALPTFTSSHHFAQQALSVLREQDAQITRKIWQEMGPSHHVPPPALRLLLPPAERLLGGRAA